MHEPSFLWVIHISLKGVISPCSRPVLCAEKVEASHQPARPPGGITPTPQVSLSLIEGRQGYKRRVQGSDCRTREAALQLLLLECQP